MRVLRPSFFINKFIENIKEEMSYEKLEVTKGLMEAYVAMNASHEENISEEVEQIDEYAAGSVPGSGGAVTMYSRPIANTGSSYQSRFARPRNAGTPETYGGGRSATRTVRPQVGGLPSNYRGQELQAGARAAASQVGTPRQGSAGTGAAPSAAARPATTPRPSATPPATPRPSATAPASASAGSKVAPSGSTPATKPAAPKGDAMSQWAAANPKLAAAKAERDRTRGTSATTNPLMKDMKSSLPAPKAPSPTTTSTAFKSSTPSLGSSSSAVQSAGSSAGAKAFPVKPATSSQATSATTKPVAPEVKATNTAAAAPKPITPNPSGGAKSEPMKVKPLGEEIDIFDTVLEYLISEGYAETVAEAEYLMTTLDIDVIDNIVEAKYGTKAGRKKLAKKIRKGENIGKKGPGTGFKAVEKAAEKGGAEDPAAVAAAQMWKTHGR